MGSREEPKIRPSAWQTMEIDLIGPFSCKSNVNKCSSIKVWGEVIKNINSRAVYCDVIMDYSAEAVILTLKRFSSLKGWLTKISSDPGSQLDSAMGTLESWWKKMEESLRKVAGKEEFKWKINPADSPWRQGKAE